VTSAHPCERPLSGLGCRCRIFSVVEALTRSRPDFLLIDGEHGLIETGHLGPLLMAAELSDVPVVYRVRSNRADLIKPVLDLAVHAIMVPMVTSAAAAARYEGIALGTDVLNEGDIPTLFDQGFMFFTWRSDVSFLTDGATLFRRSWDNTLASRRSAGAV